MWIVSEERFDEMISRRQNMSALHWTDHAIAQHTPGHIGGLRGLIGEWLRRIESRRDLAALTDRELRDIGLTRVDALGEAGKPFWRA
jgi:uncharacterized protein YjiS (DUF1127 family)